VSETAINYCTESNAQIGVATKNRDLPFRVFEASMIGPKLFIWPNGNLGLFQI
jgi:hypothetical protein